MINKIVFIALNPEMLAAFEEVALSYGEALPVRFTTVRGPLSLELVSALKVDAIITPGNSYGHMSGGFDGALVEVFGDELWVRVAHHIVRRYHGEINVGQAFSIPCPNPSRYVQVVYAPTMRVPKVIPLPTDAVYTATRAALLAIDGDVFVNTVMMTGMGVGTGGIPPRAAAEQMCKAIMQVLNPVAPVSDLFGAAMQHDLSIYKDQL